MNSWLKRLLSMLMVCLSWFFVLMATELAEIRDTFAQKKKKAERAVCVSRLFLPRFLDRGGFIYKENSGAERILRPQSVVAKVTLSNASPPPTPRASLASDRKRLRESGCASSVKEGAAAF